MSLTPFGSLGLAVVVDLGPTLVSHWATITAVTAWDGCLVNYLLNAF